MSDGGDEREALQQKHSSLFSPVSLISHSLSLSLNLQMEMESSPRRSSFGNSSSPEFEFWMVGNNHPELEPTDLLTADELFVDGVLLPLHLLSLTDPKSSINLQSKSEPKVVVIEAPAPAPHPEASICSSSAAPLTSSKRWKDIFKVGGEKKKEKETSEEKEKKREKKAGNGGGTGGGSAELNINIWPFSRSRSAGTAAAGRSKAAGAMRKSSSAPCSRSNSRGERRWAASPCRAGVHVARASPVWQARRATKAGRAGSKGLLKGLNLNGGLNLNVNSCIGYRGRCRGEESDGGGVHGANGLFRIRALFSKKVH